MGDIVKIKHLLWTIGGMLVFAFGLGMNVNSKLSQVDINKTNIEVLRQDFKDDVSIRNKNHEELVTALHDLELQIKLALKDKKDRK